MRAERDRSERSVHQRIVRLHPAPLTVTVAGGEVAELTDDVDIAIPTWGRAFKRTVDVVAAGVGVVVSLPVLAAIALAVRIDSPGPALFVQTRVGRDGRRFKFYK